MFAAAATFLVAALPLVLPGHLWAAAQRAEPLYAWIRGNTPSGVTFHAERDTTLYLRTGRHAPTMRGPAHHFYTEDRAAILAESAKLGQFALARAPRYRAVCESPAGTILKADRSGE